MYGFMLFLHLAGLAAWFGVTLMSAFLLNSLKGKLTEAGSTASAFNTIKLFNRITHPAAAIVLISGFYMIMQLSRAGMPFWLTFMERAGSLIIILFMAVLSMMGAKLKKKLAQDDTTAASKSISTYVTSIFVFLVLILAVTLVVSLKL